MKYLLIVLLFIVVGSAHSQSLQGLVTDDKNEPLPFATIYIRQLETGITTNAQGLYQIRLKPGIYEVLFQFMGYEAITQKVTVGSETVELNVVLAPVVYQLRTAEISADAEDPAYTIMRKAIAKSKYHTLQLDSYTSKVYVKGTSQLKNTPFFLRKQLEKEGIDTNTLFLTESISQITYERPNKVTEHVLSVRTVGEPDSNFTTGFIQGSFYHPEVAGAISPFSPRAFAYYRFRLDGVFYENGREINKIRVMPRSRGDDVFDGYLYVVEHQWSIHSLTLITYKQGIKFTLSQIYEPIQESVWLPVSHQFTISGSMLGFGGEYKYLATVSDYKITLNPDLKIELVVVDEKIDKELAKALIQEEKNSRDQPTGKEEKNIFDAQQKLTRKSLRKMLKTYEKAEQKEEKEPDVIGEMNLTIDSNVYENDSAFWATARPVPLNEQETSSYKKMDSMAVVQLAEREGRDSVPISTGFGLGEILIGYTTRLGKKGRLKYHSPFAKANFNTVEGYHFDMALTYTRHYADSKKLIFTPSARYAFAREKVVGKLQTSYKYGRKAEQGSFNVEGGRYISQFNESNAIHPFINTVYTLFAEENYLKIFEKDYVKVSNSQQLTDGMIVASSVEWQQRQQLYNNARNVFFPSENRSFTANTPVNIEGPTGFGLHQALLLNVDVKYRPFLKYSKYGGKKHEIPGSSPEFRLSYNKGIKDVASSDVDFDRLEAGFQYLWQIGVRGTLRVNTYAGTYLNNNATGFMDFKHFPGNQTLLQISSPEGSYRLLDYYAYSTDNQYAALHTYYQFRKFLFTQIFELRMMGIKESFVANYLKTSNSPNYWEVGYSLDNIFRLFRVEAVTGWQDGTYQEFGIRIGVSSNIAGLISVN